MFASVAACTLLVWSPVAAQDALDTQSQASSASEAASEPETSATASTTSQIVIQHLRPADQRGVRMFEAPKNDGVPFTGFRIDWSAAFAQQFQGLDHSNDALANPNANGVDQNQLYDMGAGFNTAAANLGLNIQVAPGIRVALTAYLSSKHHNEAWVKDGYFLMDASPIDVPVLKAAMEYLTVKVGHFEIDYGDAHYRRSDNGNAMYNPFVGNLIMDAFTTQVGGHVYFRNDMGLIAMGGITGGEIKGEIRAPDSRAPAYLAKLGFDRQINEDLRVRLMGSFFDQDRALNNTLYSGDRAGSRYNFVLENTLASGTGNAWSGNLNPGFRNEVQAVMVNPYVEFGGLELFGTWERSTGRAHGEAQDREWRQYAGDVVYRFLENESVYVAGRYNVAEGELAGIADEVSVDRVQIGGGWFVTPTVLFKAEWVNQTYNDFPATDIRSDAQFDGFMLEGVVAF
ncbi:MAG TPA: hypothetical protein VF039_06005 [Longimicrobiales bacterium]